MKSEVKTARITLPESIYMQLKQAAKADKNYKSVGDYVVHQLDQVKILACENDKLTKKLREERLVASQSIAASEERVAKVEKDVKSVQDERDNLMAKNAELDERIVVLRQEKAVFETANTELNSKIIVLETERAAFEMRVTEAEEQVKKLKKELSNISITNDDLARQNGELASRNAELREEKEQLKEINQSELSIRLKAESDLQAIGMELRKKEQEKSELENKIASRNAIIEGLHQELREKRTILGKIKNLFS